MEPQFVMCAWAPSSVFGMQRLHWNLFFTLAAVAIVAPFIERRHACAAWQRAAWCTALLSLHQLALSWGGLRSFVRNAPRTGWVSANKEGLVSLPGYLALSLAGGCAADLFRACLVPPSMSHTMGPLAFGAAALAMWVASELLDVAVEPTSRRVCNAAYVAWIAAQTLLSLGLCALPSLPAVPLLHHHHHHPQQQQHEVELPLLEAVGHQPLGFFLAANLLTGAVNLAMETDSADALSAAMILAAYMALLCVGAVYRGEISGQLNIVLRLDSRRSI